MKELKTYAHLYLGQVMRYVGKGKPFRGTKVDEPLTIDNYELLLFSNDRRLVLRPLSDMTEEEGRKYVELRGYEAINSVTILAGGIEFTHPGMNTYISFENNKPEQFAFLLSNGFDIFGLIEAGLAVSKTETK